MVEWFGAMQGQEYTQTKWGLGLRLPQHTDNDIESELNEGKILRTHLLRPTWHFVSSNDIYWLLKLTAPRVHTSNAYMYRQMELSDKVFNQCNDILITTLEGAKHLTREAINEEFKKHKIIAKGHRLSYIMMNAELEGIVCSGARQGNQFTYTLLEERVKHKNSLDKDEALAQLSIRYFNSRNPATVKDFATWSGLTIGDCKKGIGMIKKSLHKEIIAQQEYFLNPDTSLPDKQLGKIHFLPIYDEFIMGYKDRNAIMTLKNNASFRYDSMVVYEGQVIGTWKRTITKNSIDIEYDFFKPLNSLQCKVWDESLNQMSCFFNLKVNRP
ncbi:winged helix DNA-binding domain-containing protein [Rhodocytophaga rosea]|uniref:Winged helix DNA-binding domain-containing protein n=1 Tax=Rhodocytophaga rosea TaxID=2704465 RepID=A0A6C0GJ77_9BACT|nr:winged helix DNA-binding domain-containing protein [Rhodocytophaga rosea]QHT68121.1 winged helix DNA-binding domain-containing protein [Rhodocytophaga rosea]